MPDRRQQGAAWERTAESFLRRRGLNLLARNYHCRFGEIDLVMLDGATLVFVEVRYRRRDRFGSGAATVTRTKQRRIASAAGRFLRQFPQHGRRACRFDVVSIGGGAAGAELDWIRSAFDAQ